MKTELTHVNLQSTLNSSEFDKYITFTIIFKRDSIFKSN